MWNLYRCPVSDSLFPMLCQRQEFYVTSWRKAVLQTHFWYGREERKESSVPMARVFLAACHS